MHSPGPTKNSRLEQQYVDNKTEKTFCIISCAMNVDRGINFLINISKDFRESHNKSTTMPKVKVIIVGSDTFGNPIFLEGLQNQPFSRIISVLICFAQLCQLAKNGLSKSIFYQSSKSFSIFFSLKNTNLEAHFLLLAFFDKINFLTTLLLKLGQIFDEVAKHGKSTQDAYNPGKWLIL